MARAFDDASTQYLRTTSVPLTDEPITMAGWFYSDSIALNQTIMCIGDTGGADHYWRIIAAGAVGGDPVRAQASGTTVTSTADTTTGYSANTWHHAIGTFDTSSITVRIDGGNEGSDSQTPDPSAADDVVAIGAFERSSIIHYMSGNIAESAMWNAILTAAEAQSLAAGYSPLLIRPQSLVAYWPLIGRTSPEIDIVGGYNMTLVNTPTTAAHPRIIYPGRQIYTPPTVAAAAGIPTHFMHYAKMRRG